LSLILLLIHTSAPQRVLHSFPTRRSSDLLRPAGDAEDAQDEDRLHDRRRRAGRPVRQDRAPVPAAPARPPRRDPAAADGRGSAADRKSTRLNSSHVKISYAVFCLKKKTQK